LPASAGGAPRHQPVERFLDHRLILRIDRRERLVQYQDRRVAQEGAGDGDALALAAGELDAPLAHQGGVAPGQGHDEVVGIGGARRGLQLRLAGLGLAEAQVLFHRAVEQVCVLVDDRQLAADLREAEGLQVVAAQQDPALVGIVKPEQQTHDRGLAGAALADHADALTRSHGEAQALVRRAAPAGIGKTDVLESQGGGQRSLRVLAGIGDRRLAVK
jgi:hypothetical protein